MLKQPVTCARHQLHLKTLLLIEKFTSLVPSRNVILQYIIQFDCLQGVEKKKNLNVLLQKWSWLRRVVAYRVPNIVIRLVLKNWSLRRSDHLQGGCRQV